ncbi:MAG TPA: hypothetical protein VGZ05_04010 [Steroidobacteraceae bacterium]|nr:hypothetical protein [Steroidobacteraceae bacterium]
MIGREHTDVHPLDARLRATLPARERDSERLEVSECTGGLRELGLAGARRSGGILVEPPGFLIQPLQV